MQMNDWGLSTLGRYPIAVRGTRKVRGALLCDTSEGWYLLQEYKGSEKRLKREAQILTFLEKQCGYLVDSLAADGDGNLCSANEEGNRYLLKRWYLFPECNVNSRGDISQAVRLLAKLHAALRNMPREEEQEEDIQQAGLNEIYEKHTRELHRVRMYLKRKKKKTPMEEWIVKSFPEMYEQAQKAQEALAQSAYSGLLQQAQEKGYICHGAYHQHNVLIGGGQIASVNYEHYETGLQLTDLYQFMRKILEKHNWNIQIGGMMLEEYNRILPLTKEEREVLSILFEYPEKYWKQVNFYFNRNKAWIPARSLEKLQNAANQYPMRNAFIGTINIQPY